MDFYDDRDKSVYRPWITVDELKADPRFRYVDGMLVVRFEEHDGYVAVECLDVRTGERVEHRARRLVLAAGTLGTARIVLRSQGSGSDVLPLLCNPYSYVPCLQPSLVGARTRPLRMSLAQLSMFHDPDGSNTDVAMGSIYSYRSLMLFRILPQAPIAMADARILMRYLHAGDHHRRDPPPRATGTRPAPRPWRIRRFTDGGPPPGRVRPHGPRDQADRRPRADLHAALRSLGAWAIKRIQPGMGSSIHYAGTLPFAGDGRPFSLATDGRLAGTAAVSVADGSGFRYLPAKGLTLSLMANAHLVAREALRRG